ncbi:MAG: PCRF domain-containing protein, partial [Rickettsiales bacterium]
MSIDNKLDSLIGRHTQLRDQLAAPGSASSGEFGKLSKELSDLTPVVETALALKQARQELKEADAMIADSGGDAEMKALAEEEKKQLLSLVPKLEHDLKLALLPKDEADEKNAILEVRAGTGGEEAALFASELFRMYQ